MVYSAWWLGTEEGHGNFGDILTPFILDYYKINYKYTSSYSNADLISVGSIARRASNKTTVLGSGIIRSNDVLAPQADYKFVRGPHTRNRILEQGGVCPEIYGDPALLLPKIYNPKIKKNIDIGYVPHNVDFEFINPRYNYVIHLSTKNYKDVIDKMLNCKKIVSSSLHGVIVAHAYGIPAAWVKSRKKLKGGRTKFEDYYASVGLPAVMSTYENPIFSLPKSIDTSKIDKIFREFSNKGSV